MTQQLSITDGNKLIETFLGNQVNGEHVYVNDSGYKWWFHISACTYHKSWDALMSVVQSIQNKGYDFFIFNDEDGEQAMIYGAGFSYSRMPESLVVPNKPGQGNNKITTVWNTVIDFILWYNTQPKPLTT